MKHKIPIVQDISVAPRVRLHYFSLRRKSCHFPSKGVRYKATILQISYRHPAGEEYWNDPNVSRLGPPYVMPGHGKRKAQK